jgi:hypothetical protein
MELPPDRCPENREGTVIFGNLICAVPTSLLLRFFHLPPAGGSSLFERIEEVKLLWGTKPGS